MGKLSPAVLGLLIANGVMFAATHLLPGMGQPMREWFALWFPRNEHFALWQYVTYMFMHGGIGHIIFNMFALVSFGLLLERLWGMRKFLIFYALCGIGAAIVFTMVNGFEFHTAHAKLVSSGVPAEAIDLMLKTGKYSSGLSGSAVSTVRELYLLYAIPMVGASGAIYGVLVAFSLLFPNAKLALIFLPVPIKAKYFIPILLGLDLLGGVTGFSLFGGSIAHFAHIGGALIGFLLMWSWRSQARRAGAVHERF